MLRVPENTSIIGELRTSGAIRVDGRIEGGCNINGTLLITTNAVCLGKIIADEIVVEGIAEGQIVARSRILLKSTAQVRGSIKSPSMRVMEGAHTRCRVRIGNPPAPANLQHDIHKKTVEELAKYRRDKQSA